MLVALLVYVNEEMCEQMQILSFLCSMLPTTAISLTHPMPVCTYTIRKDEIDGPVLRYARVGEQVVHRWECQSGECEMIEHNTT